MTSSKEPLNKFDNDNEEVSLGRSNNGHQHPPQIMNNRRSNGLMCPSCGDYFDSAKKRRLIDNCGHERCYTCMFNKGMCPLCNEGGI
jgi:hypothetical protein